MMSVIMLLQNISIVILSAQLELEFGLTLVILFLDPVGSLVSTLWVVGCCWSLVGHTFSKLVNFECVGLC